MDEAPINDTFQEESDTPDENELPKRLKKKLSKLLPG
jgi:hypothetical protein